MHGADTAIASARTTAANTSLAHTASSRPARRNELAYPVDNAVKTTPRVAVLVASATGETHRLRMAKAIARRQVAEARSRVAATPREVDTATVRAPHYLHGPLFRERKSGMVRRAYEVCVKDLLAAWSGAPTRGLDGDEHGVNVGQHIRVVHRQNPPARRFVVNGEEA